MAEILARFILTRRYWILAAVGIITVFLGAFSLRIDLNQRPDELMFRDDPDYPRLQAFFEEFGYDEMVAAAFAADNVLDPETLRSVQEITEELSRIEGITRVLSIGNAQDVFEEDGSLVVAPLLRRLPEGPVDQEVLKKRISQNPLYSDLLVSEDNRIALFDITLDAKLRVEERDAVLKAIDAVFSEKGNGNPHYMAGSPIGRSELFRCMRRDFSTLLPMGIFLLIVAMYLIFRNYLCILLPFVAVSLSVVWTFGTMCLAGTELNFFSVLIPTILFIVGTSDCIHILSQYQDCRKTCSSKSEAVSRTIQLMLVPCFLTSLTTMIGFLSLTASRIEALRLFGIFCAAGMGFAYLLSVTLLPIGLSIGDTRQFSLRKPPSEAFLGILRAVHRFNLKRTRLLLPLFLILFLLAAFGASRLHVETDPAKFFGKNIRVVTDMVFIEQKLGGFIPFFVVIEGQEQDRIKDPLLLDKVDRLGAFIRKQPGVDKVVSGTDLIKYMNFRLQGSDPSAYKIPRDPNAVAELLLMASMSDDSGLIARFFTEDYSKACLAIRFRHHDFDSYQKLMNSILPYLQAEFLTVHAVKTYVTGTNMMLANTLMPFLQGLNQGIVFAGASIFALMIFLYRSLRMGIISMLANVVPITITFGFMGLFGISLNFATAPLASIALGLAIDDTIHFLSRFRREFSSGEDYEAAIIRTMESVGKPIVTTSLILTAGFLIFLLSNFQYTRNMGMLISFTVVSALLGDLILLPVLLLVLKPLGRKHRR
jgi:hypothetical protein